MGGADVASPLHPRPTLVPGVRRKPAECKQRSEKTHRSFAGNIELRLLVLNRLDDNTHHCEVNQKIESRRGKDTNQEYGGQKGSAVNGEEVGQSLVARVEG